MDLLLYLWIGGFRLDHLPPVHVYRIQIRWHRLDSHLFLRRSRQQADRGGWRATFEQAPRLAPPSSRPHAGLDAVRQLREYGCGIGLLNCRRRLQQLQFQHSAFDAPARLLAVLPDWPLPRQSHPI